MFNKNFFKEKIHQLQENMKMSPRKLMDEKLEVKIIDEIFSIFQTMADRFDASAKSGSSFRGQPGISDLQEKDRAYHAYLDLIKRMELDFLEKLTMDFKHGLEKEIEIGKIKITILDGVHRTLNMSIH